MAELTKDLDGPDIVVEEETDPPKAIDMGYLNLDRVLLLNLKYLELNVGSFSLINKDV